MLEAFEKRGKSALGSDFEKAVKELRHKLKKGKLDQADYIQPALTDVSSFPHPPLEC